MEKENENLKRDIEELKTSLKNAEAALVRLDSVSKESMQKDDTLEKKIAELNEEIDRMTKENTSIKVIMLIALVPHI